MKLSVLFSDNYLLVIDKPPGIVTDPSETQKEATIADILKTDYQINLERSGIVHRLDKDTSGILIVAKTQTALDNLKSQFKERTIKKQYLCLVHGFLKSPIKVEGSIIRNPLNRQRFIVDPKGKEAATSFLPEDFLTMSDILVSQIFPDFNKIQIRKLKNLHYQEFTYLKCYPLTGRTHQIRVHLKHINFPLVGDEKYSGKKLSRLDHRWCKRQFLHASKLEFTHPITNQKIVVESALPMDLQESLGKLTNS